jgi:hypothetical protein
MPITIHVDNMPNFMSNMSLGEDSETWVQVLTLKLTSSSDSLDKSLLYLGLKFLPLVKSLCCSSS